MKLCPMNKDFILFCCLHCGLLSPSNIKEKCSLPKGQSNRNKKLLGRLIDTYGSCAMLAMEGDFVVAHARFYPHIIYNQFEFCCHDPNHAITQEMVEMKLPPLDNSAERILSITCFFVHKDYRGQGLSHKLIDAILEWAKNNDWKSIRCFAYPDNYWLSSEMCTPMLRTYSKHGFRKIGTVMIPEAKDLLQQMQNGELGPERKKEIEKICGNKDLLEFASFYEMERQL
jgi:GNAT superfamily N-acetyltransferase